MPKQTITNYKKNICAGVQLLMGGGRVLEDTEAQFSP
jgi:hypothetical protein